MRRLCIILIFLMLSFPVKLKARVPLALPPLKSAYPVPLPDDLMSINEDLDSLKTNHLDESGDYEKKKKIWKNYKNERREQSAKYIKKR